MQTLEDLDYLESCRMSDNEPITPEQASEDEALRLTLRDYLQSGLKTEVEPRAYTSEQVNEIINRLQSLDETDYRNKLIIAGFTLTPYKTDDDDDVEQACETCMYYLVHRRFCELPELMLPVDDEWSCRLWRI